MTPTNRAEPNLKGVGQPCDYRKLVSQLRQVQLMGSSRLEDYGNRTTWLLRLNMPLTGYYMKEPLKPGATLLNLIKKPSPLIFTDPG